MSKPRGSPSFRSTLTSRTPCARRFGPIVGGYRPSSLSGNHETARCGRTPTGVLASPADGGRPRGSHDFKRTSAGGARFAWLVCTRPSNGQGPRGPPSNRPLLSRLQINCATVVVAILPQLARTKRAANNRDLRLLGGCGGGYVADITPRRREVLRQARWRIVFEKLNFVVGIGKNSKTATRSSVTRLLDIAAIYRVPSWRQLTALIRYQQAIEAIDSAIAEEQRSAQIAAGVQPRTLIIRYED